MPGFITGGILPTIMIIGIIGTLPGILLFIPPIMRRLHTLLISMAIAAITVMATGMHTLLITIQITTVHHEQSEPEVPV